MGSKLDMMYESRQKWWNEVLACRQAFKETFEKEMLKQSTEDEQRREKINQALSQVRKAFKSQALSAMRIVEETQKQRRLEQQQDLEKINAMKLEAKLAENKHLEAEKLRKKKEYDKKAKENAQKAKEEEEKKHAAAMRAKMSETAIAATAAAAEGGSIDGNTDYVSASALKEYRERNGSLVEIRKGAKQIADAADQETRRIRMSVKKMINTQIQQISASTKQILDKSHALITVLDDCSKHSPVLYAFALECIATRFVAQGDSQVYLHRDSSYPIGEVVVRVCAEHDVLVNVLLNTFAIACPYTVPHYIPRGPSEPGAHHKKRIGFRGDPTNPDSMESLESYQERMGGIIALFAAILQTPWNRPQGHAFGIGSAWKWLARTLNMTPRRITAWLLDEFIHVAGYELSQSYGRQFGKLLDFINDDFINRLSKKAAGPAVRLKLFVLEYNRHGGISMPKGRQYKAD